MKARCARKWGLNTCVASERESRMYREGRIVGNACMLSGMERFWQLLSLFPPSAGTTHCVFCSLLCFGRAV